MNKEKFVVGIGEALWDILPEGKKLGGAPANFAYHVSQFGLNSCVVSAVGNDELGNEILNKFKDKSLHGVVETVPFPTGTVLVTLDSNGIPNYEIKEAVAWDNIPYTSKLEELVKDTCAVCFGSLAQRNAVSQETIIKFINSIPNDEYNLKIFDINLRQHFYTKEILSYSFEICNILKINDEELEIITEIFNLSGKTIEEKCRVILEKYKLKVLILTCGTKGSYIFTHDDISFKPTPHVKVVDTVGAGDSFTAGFVASILKGKSISEAHEMAVEVSAFVCTQNGAMPILPSFYTK